MKVAWLVLPAVLAACSSPQKEANEARDTAASWASTGAVLAREWSRGHVTDAYTRSTARVATEEVNKLTKLDARARDAQLRAWDALERAAEAHEPAAAAPLARTFAALAKKSDS
ncbi:MAG: hypothetical protein JO197_20620 [Acidobacteria bacterium]|nr:hypothetical protein [Acidobacteriota bacterium]MBV9474495.1 hypothetical protein [Acidobacteriota bacterium]